MATIKKYDAVATVGTYKDRQTGEDKKRYVTVGAVFEGDDGRLSLKLDAVPCSPDWSGWISFYEPDRNQQGRGNNTPRQQSAPPQRSAGNQQPPADDFQDDDDIPF